MGLLGKIGEIMCSRLPFWVGAPPKIEDPGSATGLEIPLTYHCSSTQAQCISKLLTILKRMGKRN